MRHTLIPLDTFMALKTSIYYPGSLAYRIASYVVGRPLWWALQQMNLVDGEEASTSGSSSNVWKDVRGPYIFVPILERVAEIVLERQKGADLSASLYSFESFKNKYGAVGAVLPDVALSETDLKVLLKYFIRDKGVIVVQGVCSVPSLLLDKAH